MRTMILIAMLAAACGTDAADDPHALVTCDPDVWGLITTECELACRTTPSGAPQSACSATLLDGTAHACAGSFAFGDARGCCATVDKGNDTYEAQFAECE